MEFIHILLFSLLGISAITIVAFYTYAKSPNSPRMQRIEREANAARHEKPDPQKSTPHSEGQIRDERFREIEGRLGVVETHIRVLHQIVSVLARNLKDTENPLVQEPEGMEVQVTEGISEQESGPEIVFKTKIREITAAALKEFKQMKTQTPEIATPEEFEKIMKEVFKEESIRTMKNN